MCLGWYYPHWSGPSYSKYDVTDMLTEQSDRGNATPEVLSAQGVKLTAKWTTKAWPDFWGQVRLCRPCWDKDLLLVQAQAVKELLTILARPLPSVQPLLRKFKATAVARSAQICCAHQWEPSGSQGGRGRLSLLHIHLHHFRGLGKAGLCFAKHASPSFSDPSVFHRKWNPHVPDHLHLNHQNIAF